jgi:predicted aspartyl protease
MTAACRRPPLQAARGLDAHSRFQCFENIQQEMVMVRIAARCGRVPVYCRLVLAVAALAASGATLAERFGTRIPMYDKGASTLYVKSHVSGLGATEMMVDTGSGYMTINEEALKTLSAQGKAHYVKPLLGVLANGQEIEVPVYRLDALRIGGDCWLRDVQAAVFPGRTRFILGLSALAKASPFIFEFDPPQLVLSNCGKTEHASLADLKVPEAPATEKAAERVAAVVER